MNNNNKSKEKNEFIEEIERVKQSGGGEALLDREIIEMLLSSVHSRTQAQAITKSLMDNCPGIGRILGRDIDGLNTERGKKEISTTKSSCMSKL